MSFNLAVILSETAQSSPDQPVAVFAGGQLTYRELDQASDRLAATLAAAGLRPGDPVALQLPNIPQFLVSYFGILKAGGVVVPLNVMLQAPEVAFHLSDSGARILITWEGVLAEAAKGAEAAGLDQVYAVGHADDPGAGGSGGAVPFERLLDAEVPHFEMATREPMDTAVIVYTSGTTGRPKGAELRHIQLYMNADIPGRLSRCGSTRFAAHDQDRAGRVMHAVLADRTEQRLGEFAVTAAADDEQIRADRGVKQHLRRISVDDQASHPLAVGRRHFLADHRFNRLLGVIFEAAVLFYVDRCHAVALEHHRNLPGQDGVDRAAGEVGLPESPAQRHARRRRTIYSHHDPRRAIRTCC
jgi:acyl-CoA synthetase (AMP-forming)/AMP-acid ligase II